MNSPLRVLAAALLLIASSHQAFAVTYGPVAPTVSGGIDSSGTVLTGVFGFADDGIGTISGFDQGGYAEWTISAGNVPVGATITGVNLTYSTTPLSAGFHTLQVYTSTAAGSITLADFGAPTTLTLGSGLSGGQSFSTAALMSQINSVLGTTNGNPTVGNGTIGFRWIPSGGSTAEFLSATLRIDYTQPNTPPQAVLAAVPNYSATNLNQMLNGGGSFDTDAGNTITNYAFQVNGGPLISGANATPNLHISQTGLTDVNDTNTVTLVVTDNNGANSTNLAQQTIDYDNTRPVAQATLAGGNFDVSMSSRTASGSTSFDPDAVAVNGFIPNFDNIVSYTWSHTGTNAVSVPVTFAQAVTAGMSEDTTGSISLNVTDMAGQNDLTPSSLVLTYNAANATANSSSTSPAGPNTQFSGTASDPDLVVNAAHAGFSSVLWEFDTTAAANAGQIGNGVLPGAFANLTGTHMGTSSSFNINQMVNSAALLGLLGPGLHNIFFNVTDSRGNVVSTSVSTLNFAIPEPTTIAIWSVLGMAAIGIAVRRKRK